MFTIQQQREEEKTMMMVDSSYRMNNVVETMANQVQSNDLHEFKKFIEEEHLTAMMVTHNMKDAIAHGNRLIMMNNGQIILDVSGEEKKKLTVEYLLEAFTKLSGSEFANDRALLS